MDKLLTVEQAAERLSLSHWTLRTWVRDDKIEYYKIGRNVRIRQAVVDAIIEAGSPEARKSKEG